MKICIICGFQQLRVMSLIQIRRMILMEAMIERGGGAGC